MGRHVVDIPHSIFTTEGVIRFGEIESVIQGHVSASCRVGFEYRSCLPSLPSLFPLCRLPSPAPTQNRGYFNVLQSLGSEPSV